MVNQSQRRNTEAGRKSEEGLLPQVKENWYWPWNALEDLKAGLWQHFSGTLGSPSLSIPGASAISGHTSSWKGPLPLAFSFDFQPRYGLCVCSHSLPATTEGENDTEGSPHPSLNTATQASALTSKLSFSPKAL